MDQSYVLPSRPGSYGFSTYSAGGSKGPARPLGGVRGKEAWGASRDRPSPSPRRRRRRKRKETRIATQNVTNRARGRAKRAVFSLPSPLRGVAGPALAKEQTIEDQ